MQIKWNVTHTEPETAITWSKISWQSSEWIHKSHVETKKNMETCQGNKGIYKPTNI